MKLTYSYHTDYTDDLVFLMKASNNLYNQALYIVKQELENNNKWLWYNDLDKIMKTVPNLDGKFNYRMLPSVCAQQILRLLDSNIKGYCKLIKDWSKHKEKYRGKPQFPCYRKRGSLYSLLFANGIKRVRDGKLFIRRDLSIPIPQWDKYKDRITNFNQIRLIPKNGYIKVEIVYESEQIKSNVDKTKYASIDLGIDNLATLVTENGSCLYNGKPLKSYNQFYNKKMAKLVSIKDKQGVKRRTKRICKMYNKRNLFVDDYIHKVSRKIVDRLIEENIGNIVVGYNDNWKNEVNMGRVNNQKFTQIPFARLVSDIKYKCELAGINVVLTEESYTSKCDSLSLEKLEKHDEYGGKRIRRGLFQSSTGRLINADVNGAINILRKVVGDSEIISRIINRGLPFNPIRCNIL